jgi:hypothetical protein
MTPTLLNLTIFQGIAFDPGVLTYNDSNGNAVNITGWTANAEARETPCGPVVFDFVPSVSNGAAGQVSIALNSAQTANLCTMRGGWDLVLTAPNSERYGPIYAGRVGVSPLHTQPV